MNSEKPEHPGAIHAVSLLGEVLHHGVEIDRETPSRMARALEELTDGYATDPGELLKKFPADGFDQVVAVRGIPFASLCEHHVLPFTGTASVAYIPTDSIIGLSKIPRVVRALSRRLQVQERLTREIAEAIDQIKPMGVAVIVRGRHTCAALRGVESESEMVTSVTMGLFREDPKARAEVMELLR